MQVGVTWPKDQVQHGSGLGALQNGEASHIGDFRIHGEACSGLFYERGLSESESRVGACTALQDPHPPTKSGSPLECTCGITDQELEFHDGPLGEFLI